MLKRTVLIGALTLCALPAQAVTWSTAGAGATHIPIINITDSFSPPNGQSTLVLNNTLTAEIIAASPGKELLDIQGPGAKITGFKGIAGAGTITQTERALIFSSKGGKPLKATPYLRLHAVYPAGNYMAFQPSKRLEGSIGIANFGKKLYVVQSLAANLAVVPKPGGQYRPIYDVVLQVVDMTTGKRAKLFHFKTNAKSPVTIMGMEVNDANADGRDDLVVRYERFVGKRSLQTIRVYNLLTGKVISTARYWL